MTLIQTDLFESSTQAQVKRIDQTEKHYHLLSLGMGYESVAILLRWLFEPESRDFELDQLIVLVAQTGDEYDSTGKLIEIHILPLMRQFRIRLVQVARHGKFEFQGYTVLDDSDCPQALYLAGDYRLSQELLLSGTVPRLGRPHFCALKFKGFPLDSWIADNLEGEYVHYLGYSKGEEKRSSNSDGYTKETEKLRYPAMEWGWTRSDCGDYIYEKLGVRWLKSCCTFCPFQKKESVRERWLSEPDAGGYAAYVEEIALALNPRMHLFGFGTARKLLVESLNEAALNNYYQWLSQVDWAVYRVQRIYNRSTTTSGRFQVNADRNVFAVATGTREEMTTHLYQLAHEHQLTIVESEPKRFYLATRPEGVYPAVEDYYVICPHVVEDKCRNLKAFQKKWMQLTGEQQLELSFTYST